MKEAAVSPCQYTPIDRRNLTVPLFMLLSGDVLVLLWHYLKTTGHFCYHWRHNIPWTIRPHVWTHNQYTTNPLLFRCYLIIIVLLQTSGKWSKKMFRCFILANLWLFFFPSCVVVALLINNHKVGLLSHVASFPTLAGNQRGRTSTESLICQLQSIDDKLSLKFQSL